MTNEKPQIPSHVYLVYWRRTASAPQGAVAHHGDCMIYNVKVCTCGLLHALRPVNDARKLLEKFDEQLGAHDQALERLRS